MNVFTLVPAPRCELCNKWGGVWKLPTYQLVCIDCWERDHRARKKIDFENSVRYWEELGNEIRQRAKATGGKGRIDIRIRHPDDGEIS